jgi:hypothetical protein
MDTVISNFFRVTENDRKNEVIVITRDKAFTLQDIICSILDMDEDGEYFVEAIKKWVEHKSEVASEKKYDSKEPTDSIESSGTENSFLEHSKKMSTMKKRVLLIRPDKDPSSIILPKIYVTKLSHPASDKVAHAAELNPRTTGKNIIDLDGDKATRSNVEKALRNKNIGLVLHYGHGLLDAVCGQPFEKGKNEIMENVIDEHNLDLLKGKCVSTVSCSSSSELGLGGMACNHGTRAYLGYSLPTCTPYDPELREKLIEAVNAANIELLDGKTFEEAYKKGNDTYELKYQELDQMLQVETNPFKWLKILWAACILLWMKAGFKLIGDGSAQAF